MYAGMKKVSSNRNYVDGVLLGERDRNFLVLRDTEVLMK